MASWKVNRTQFNKSQTCVLIIRSTQSQSLESLASNCNDLVDTIFCQCVWQTWAVAGVDKCHHHHHLRLMVGPLVREVASWGCCWCPMRLMMELSVRAVVIWAWCSCLYHDHKMVLTWSVSLDHLPHTNNDRSEYHVPEMKSVWKVCFWGLEILDTIFFMFTIGGFAKFTCHISS